MLVIRAGLATTDIGLDREPNDTLADALVSGIGPGSGSFFSPGEIGDNDRLPDDPGLDVDLVRIVLADGDRVVIDLDADVFGSSLDSILTLFDSRGTVVDQNDDESEETFDSYLNFVATASGAYYVGVSGYGNSDYDPLTEGSGSLESSTGPYDLSIQIFGGGAAARSVGYAEAKGGDLGVTASQDLPQVLVPAQVDVDAQVQEQQPAVGVGTRVLAALRVRRLSIERSHFEPLDVGWAASSRSRRAMVEDRVVRRGRVPSMTALLLPRSNRPATFQRHFSQATTTRAVDRLFQIWNDANTLDEILELTPTGRPLSRSMLATRHVAAASVP